ncbi:MAG TPA: AAA family ATPase, partial [Herpetosiphonaceae bacterium]|nr:AAA family ATPase [Herpetosiphonaceae bacterium]
MTRTATAKQREADAARRAIVALIDGRPAYGASKETCGEWWTMVSGLGEVREREGAQAVGTAVEALKRAHPSIARLLVGLETGSARIVPVSAEELRAKPIAPLRWAVPGIVPAGLTILAGAPKMGKSWLCFDLAIGIAQGGSVLGGVEVEQGSVLYLALEDNERRLRQRLDKLLEGG